MNKKKNKLHSFLDNTLGNEVIGEIEGEEEKQNKETQRFKKPVKPSSKSIKKDNSIEKDQSKTEVTQVKQEQVKSETKKSSALDALEALQSSFEGSQFNSSSSNSTKTKQMLTALGIPEKRDLKLDFTMEDLANTEIELVFPTGFDPDVTEEVLNNAIQTMYQYEEYIDELKNDFDILLDESLRLQDELQNVKEKSELANMMSDSKLESDTLREKVFILTKQNDELIAEINKLKEELNNKLGQQKDDSQEKVKHESNKEKQKIDKSEYDIISQIIKNEGK